MILKRHYRKRMYRRVFGRRRSVKQVVALAMVFAGMIAILVATLVLHATTAEDFSSPWHYECHAGLCQKFEMTANVTAPLSLGVCELFCGEAGSLWPKPTGHFSLGNYVVQLNPDNIQLDGIGVKTAAGNLLRKNIINLKQNVHNLGGKIAKSGGIGLLIHVGNKINTSDVKLTLTTNERYILQINQLEDGRLNVSIDAKTYFGARHALETLSQLIVFNDLRNEIQIVRDVYIVDGPVYPYRGVLLDTSRNFIEKDNILRTIKAMGMSKLNTFHWHITDSHSFPYVSRTWPKFSKYGAYTPQKVYSEADVKEIIEFGLLHGVRVLPEFDAPAHVGEGWQWVGDNATVCFNKQPWASYCAEPPCGQLNPGSERVYEVLEGIYTDMINDFHPDIFHMGGDEVNVACWNSSEVVTEWMTSKGWNRSSEEGFIKVWDYFQERALEKVKLANGGKDIPVILWTSTLTDAEYISYLDPKKYIIQIWTTGTDEVIARLIKNDFRIIFSNYDALYFDCGFGAWIGEGNNWCSPYKGWQLVYDNSPLALLLKQGIDAGKKSLILGGEATLWSEQADGAAVDSRIWPRAAALGERLWAEPNSTWIHAQYRMLQHRERMVRQGIQADSLQPQWCLQNQGNCDA